MQQTGVIGVFDILRVEFPVGVNELAGVAQYPDRSVEDPVEPGPHGRAQIVGQRFSLRRKGSKDQPVIGIQAQFSERVLGGIKVGRIAALPANAGAKRDANQIALLVIAPLVVDTGMGGPVAPRLATHQRPAMGATVYKGVQLSRFVARHNDRRVADKG